MQLLNALALMVGPPFVPPQPGIANDARLPCQFIDAGGERIVIERCGMPDSPTPRLPEAIRRRLQFDRHGLAAVLVGEQWVYYSLAGDAAPVMTMDNGADYFVEGRARSNLGGKIGYIDRSLRLVIARRYDGALPFRGGVAEVCFGCTIRSDGEHQSYAGGRWQRIDRFGRERPEPVDPRKR